MHKFNNDGHNISLRMTGNIADGSDNDYQKRYYTAQPWMNVDYREISFYNDLGCGLNLDYSLPYSENGEIGLGASYSYSPDTYYIDYDTIAGEVYVNDIMRSFDREVGSNEYDLYFTLQQKWGRFVVKPGIRMEYEKLWCNIDGYTTSNTDKDYLIHLAMKLCLQPLSPRKAVTLTATLTRQAQCMSTRHTRQSKLKITLWLMQVAFRVAT